VATGAAVAVGLVPGVPEPVRAVAVLGVFCVAALLLRTVPDEIVSVAREAGGRLVRR
jgi:hypothetical protein